MKEAIRTKRCVELLFFFLNKATLEYHSVKPVNKDYIKPRITKDSSHSRSFSNTYITFIHVHVYNEIYHQIALFH